MRYRIEYADDERCSYANGRNDLLKWLHILDGEQITDIRKVYKNGNSQTVMDIYQRYLNK